MKLVAPPISASRVLLADWLELKALLSETGRSAVASVRSEWRRSGDDRRTAREFDEDADPESEPEISERAIDDIEERVVEELSLRADTLGEVYPFEITQGKDGASEQLVRRQSWSDPKTGQGIYAFCLLNSGIRQNIITVSKASSKFVQQLGQTFQVCACLAVGGYLNADVVSFGFPRATGDAFLPALQAAWKRYGSYRVLDDIPYGFDTALKDAGVDIIAWRRFADPYAGTFLLMAQVASGRNWPDKAVGDDIKGLRNWFHAPRFEHVAPAMCMPFPLWLDLDEPPTNRAGKAANFRDGIATRFEVREAKFGVIFDRGRIASCSAVALNRPANADHHIDGLDRISEVTNWVENVHGLLAERRNAA